MGMIPCCEAGHNSVNFYLIQHKSYHKYILWGRQNLYIVILFNSCKTNCRRRVAQFGRALRSGRRGRKFESCHADKEWGNRKNYDLVLNSSVLGYDKCIELITSAYA